MISKQDQEKLYRKYIFWLKIESEADLLEHVDTLKELLDNKRKIPYQLIESIFSFFVNEDDLFNPQIEEKIKEVILLYEEKFKTQEGYLFEFNANPKRSVRYPEGHFLFEEGKLQDKQVQRDWKNFIRAAVNDYLKLVVIDNGLISNKKETLLYFHYALRDYTSDTQKAILSPRKKAIICGWLTMWLTGMALTTACNPKKDPSNEIVFQGAYPTTSKADPKKSNRGKMLFARLKKGELFS